MNHAMYTSYSIIYMSLIITFIPNQNRSSRNKQTSKHNTILPSTSLRLRGLAQARRFRSGESPSPRRGLEKGIKTQRGISLRRDPSHLGEMFARSKFEWVAWATSRANWFRRIPVCLT